MISESKLLDMSIDDLDLEIGRSLLADELGSKDISDSEVRSAARRWLQSNLVRFRTGVCSSTMVRDQLMGKSKKTRNELFAAVLDALLKVGGLGPVPVASLTARLIHYGLEQLCPEFAEGQSP